MDGVLGKEPGDVTWPWQGGFSPKVTGPGPGTGSAEPEGPLGQDGPSSGGQFGPDIQWGVPTCPTELEGSRPVPRDTWLEVKPGATPGCRWSWGWELFWKTPSGFWKKYLHK